MTVYFVAISLVAVILTVRDKSTARRNTLRVPERTLLIVSALGGSVAMILTMLVVRHKTRRVKFMVGIPLMIIVQAALVIFALNTDLSVSRYDVETDKVNSAIRLALVSDLHSCDYDDGQAELISVIDAERPDAVMLCGDIFDDRLSPQKAMEFVKTVSAKYPSFYVSGNHEFWSNRADDFKDSLASHGVSVLEGTTETLDVNGEQIRISGIDDPETDRYPSRSAQYATQLRRLSESIDNEVFTVLLSHRPERIGELLTLKPDLVLSGHAHGGQWRLPVVLENGLLSPNQGLFPKYTNGEYFFEGTELIVSRGLARESTKVIPRVFNRPEIVIITLR
ncbi:MAG: DUF1294 domain-containing protein [Bacillota bacterium]